MARVTEKKFAAFSVRVWRLVQRLEKLKRGPQYTATRKKLKAAVSGLLVNL